jgi:hypothetical protein
MHTDLEPAVQRTKNMGDSVTFPKYVLLLY